MWRAVVPTHMRFWTHNLLSRQFSSHPEFTLHICGLENKSHVTLNKMGPQLSSHKTFYFSCHSCSPHGSVVLIFLDGGLIPKVYSVYQPLILCKNMDLFFYLQIFYLSFYIIFHFIDMCKNIFFYIINMESNSNCYKSYCPRDYFFWRYHEDKNAKNIEKPFHDISRYRLFPV